MISRTSKERIPILVLSIIILAALITISGSIFLYHSQKQKIVYEKQNELTAIASLKISEIESWRKEHIRDGEILQSIVPRNQLILGFLQKKSSKEQGMEILERMKIFIRKSDYNSMLLIDSTGSVRLIYPDSAKIPSINLPWDLGSDNSEVSLSDFHYSYDLPGKIHLDLQIPLFTSAGGKKVRYGTILLRIDPEKALYPLILSWPGLSKSSETLLIRQEGDSVLFLNELRHQKNTALSLKLPLIKDLPAARAVKGYKGVFEGLDYRGIPVISFLGKIPDSPWFIVAKEDKKEIYAPLNKTVIIFFLMTLLIILLILISALYLWRLQHMNYLRELNSTKDKFFSIMAHDLKSPFTSVKGFADILVERENLTSRQIKEYAAIISSSSQNAVDLLRNLTEWSRLQTNKINFNPVELDLASVIGQEVDLVNISAAQKSISITKEIPQTLKVYADRDMLHLILRNILSNSVKFSFPGGKINISATQKDHELTVAVCDYGTGINKETIDKLFKIEENVTNPGTQNEKGTGLGLILVKEFISLHGGKIFVESEEGKCTRFSFTLPLRRQ